MFPSSTRWIGGRRDVPADDERGAAAAPATGRREEEPGRREWLSAFVDEALTSRGIDYRRLAAALREEIVTENIPVGAQLPSQRELARRLGIGRTTVVCAYNVLRSESLVRSRQGAGTWVVGRPDHP
jgi:hypothetical protein